MQEQIEIIVDGQIMLVDTGISLLKSLQSHGLQIPSLCYHTQLGGDGRCGLCVVEVYTENEWRPRYACTLQIEEGMQLRTASSVIQRLRARTASLLLRRGPFPKKDIEEMLLALVEAGSGGKNSLTPDNVEADVQSKARQMDAGCILCGLCVKICAEIGKNRLTFLGRGENMRIALVEDAGEIGCGRCKACQRICPTGFIRPDAQHAFTAKLYR